MIALNLALAFALELVALVAFGLWGYHLVPHPVLRIVLAAALPLVVAVLWGTFLSPRATVTLASALKYALRLGVFALAALAFVSTQHPRSAAIFAGAVAFNLVALRLLDTDAANL